MHDFLLMSLFFCTFVYSKTRKQKELSPSAPKTASCCISILAMRSGIAEFEDILFLLPLPDAGPHGRELGTLTAAQTPKFGHKDMH